MAGQNDFLLWGTDSNANVLTQAQYLALTNRTTGVIAGKASAQQANKAWRQASIISRMISQFIIDTIPTADALDNGTIAALEANFIAAIAKTFTIPATGVVPGTYAQANITVQADGRLTIANNGRNANFANDLGTVANFYGANLNPAPPNLAALNGVPIYIRIAHTNTGASTLNINGFGAVPIVYAGGNTGVLDTAILGGVIYCFMYDGANFQLLSGQPLRPLHDAVYFGTPGAIAYGVPGGVYQIYAEVWGGGGGAAGGDGGAGAGGGYAAGWLNVVPGQVVNGVVGAGGFGVPYGSQAGNGGTSVFGGFSATGGNGASLGGSIGGIGSGGQINLRGGSGMDLDPTAPVGGQQVAIGGNSPRGGSGGSINAANVVTGASPPGGGGGANAANTVGASGAEGGIYVWF